MPELPEVETTLRGIAPALDRQVVREIRVRNPALRWAVNEDVQQACGQRVEGLWRRAKYLLIGLDSGGLLFHLGMSGSLRICAEDDITRKHDHIDVVLDNGQCLRFNDPRRFGVFQWWNQPWEEHVLLRELGPEPLSNGFSGDYLRTRSRGLRVAVKNFIMNGKIVVGVGNIYASEALFMAGIHPTRPAGRISRARYDALAAAVEDVLKRAIRHGGTTLRDFVNSEGNPGYFAQELLVYDREGRPCFQCQNPIRKKVIGQRASYYCPRCQR
jgi:formamidopyrimidine-DNA glycosylase